MSAKSAASPVLTDVSLFPRDAKPITSYRPFWAKRFGVAKFLPMSRKEMDELGWDSCDIIIVCGDAYVDHPSFGMAVIGRTLEQQGFRVGLICQPDWNSAEAFKALGKPNLFWGVSAGNMDSMINRYTADRKIRSDDAYTPGGVGGKRPDRAALVYAQRCKEAYPDAPLVLGGIEASLRRIAHYDYWSDKVRRSVLVDAKADLLLYGNAERAIIEIAHRLAKREPIETITDIRGTAFVRKATPLLASGDAAWTEIDSTDIDTPGRIEQVVNPYMMSSDLAREQGGACLKEGVGGDTTPPSLRVDPPVAQGGTRQLLRLTPMKTYNRALVDRARQMRQEMTVPECRLWFELLQKMQPRFRRQRPVGRFIVDFYCAAIKLVVELDGESHNSVEAASYDEERTAFLQSQGMTVLRFTNAEVMGNLEGVLHAIQQHCLPLLRSGKYQQS